MSQKSRSGFLYAAQSGDDPNWVKIGCTRRTPHRRLLELSGTSTVTPFIFLDARFVWRAHACEFHLHQALVEKGFEKNKEFFKIKPEQVAELFDAVERWDTSTAPKANQKNISGFQNQTFEKHLRSFEILEKINSVEDEKKKEKIEIFCSQSSTHFVPDELLQIEKMSSLGWADATYALANHHAHWLIKKNQPQNDDQGWRLVSSLFRASEKQGLVDASLRLLYWESQMQGFSLEHWWLALNHVRQQDNPSPVAHQCLLDEQNSWINHPHRSKSWGDFCSRSSTLDQKVKP